MIIATAKKKTSKAWRSKEMTWSEFLDRLREPLRTAETVREYRAMPKEERDRAKEAPGGYVGGCLTCGQRKTENVKDRSLITLDSDFSETGAWGKATLLLSCRMAAYPTHSSTPAAPRLRWVVPTDRVMTPDEYPAVARRVAQWIGIESMDPTTYEVARLMYWPSCPIDSEYELYEQEGPVLRVDDVLATYGEGDAWRDSALWPIAKIEQEIRARAAKKAGEPTEKPGIVGLFCRTWDVYAVLDEFLSDVYEPTESPDRFTFRGGSTTGGAIVYNDGAFLYSNHATDPANGGSLNAYDLVRVHRYGELDDDADESTPVSQLPSSKAMREWAVTLPQIKSQMVEERIASTAEDFADLETPKDEDDQDWITKLELHPKTGECEPTQRNAYLILTHDPALKGAMAIDLFDGRCKLLRDVPWRAPGSVVASARGELWTDLDDAGVRGYLQHKWKFRSDKDLQSALELAFHKNAFHPVRDYLNSLEWDGHHRVDTLLIDYFGAEDSPYIRAIARKWMAAAVARVMRPGCKFDSALIAVGAQGVGKSRFASILSKGWFQDSIVNMGSKEGYEALQGAWIVELSELSAMKRSDVETVKAFLSKEEDTYRAAYARRVDTHLRQCVFFGSTNELEFLRDRTGERRYWPFNVSGKPVDQEKLRANVDQLWAEAVQIFNAGEGLWLTGKAELAGWADMIQSHALQDELDGQLSEYLETPLPDDWATMSLENRRDFMQGSLPYDSAACTGRRMEVCVTEIRVEMCGEERAKGGGNDNLSRRLANLMNGRPGWTKSEKKIRVPGYGPQWVYRRDKEDK